MFYCLKFTRFTNMFGLYGSSITIFSFKKDMQVKQLKPKSRNEFANQLLYACHYCTWTWRHFHKSNRNGSLEIKQVVQVYHTYGWDVNGFPYCVSSRYEPFQSNQMQQKYAHLEMLLTWRRYTTRHRYLQNSELYQTARRFPSKRTLWYIESGVVCCLPFCPHIWRFPIWSEVDTSCPQGDTRWSQRYRARLRQRSKIHFGDQRANTFSNHTPSFRQWSSELVHSLVLSKGTSTQLVHTYSTCDPLLVNYLFQSLTNIEKGPKIYKASRQKKQARSNAGLWP